MSLPGWQSSTADCVVALEQLPETAHGLSRFLAELMESADRESCRLAAHRDQTIG